MTTQTPGVAARPEPCWTVLNEDGEGIGYEGAEYHFEQKTEAEQDAKNYPGMVVTVAQVGDGFCCWTATLLCGKPFIYEGDEREVHFADEAHLLACASVQGNLVIPGKGLTCDPTEQCDVCTPLRRARKQELAMRDTHPDVFTRDRADDVTDPTEIDWEERRRTSLMPVHIEDDRPVCPWGHHLPYGRGALGHWGEKANADAIVFARVGCRIYVLMGERDDGHGWAFPGGGREGEETAVENALRELFEETGLRIDPVKRAGQITEHRVRRVRDPRESREAWMVTVPVVVNLGEVAQLPTVAGSDDLLRAEWFPCDTAYRVTDRIAALGGKLFEAHEQMLTEAIHGALR